MTLPASAPLPSRVSLLKPAGPAVGREVQLQADYFEGQIDIRAFRVRHPHYPVLSANPLVLEPELGSWIYVERFGAVVFWNCAPLTVDAFLNDLQALPDAGPRVGPSRDSLVVHVGAEEDTVGFSAVWVKELTLDKLKIISLAIAQSVALDFFEHSVSAAMAKFQPVVRAMRERGALPLRQHEVLTLVAFAMEIRSVVLENLTLFDDPPESWESESLAHLDSALFDQFNLEERINAINQKLAYLKDAGATLLEVLAHRKSVRLEWIVIILIAIEVVFFVWIELLPLL